MLRHANVAMDLRLPFPLHPPRKALAVVRLFPLFLLRFADGAVIHGLGTFERDHEQPKTKCRRPKEHSAYTGKRVWQVHSPAKIEDTTFIGMQAQADASSYHRLQLNGGKREGTVQWARQDSCNRPIARFLRCRRCLMG